MANRLIEGTLVDARTGGATGDLHVEAYDVRHGIRTRLGEATSDERGRFQLPVSERLLGRLNERGSSVFFIVRQGDEIVADTRKSARWDPSQDREMEIPVELGDVQLDKPMTTTYEVAGRVLTERGTPAAGLNVRVFDLRFRSEVQLGETTTDADGDYSVEYRIDQLGGKRLADLEVRVLRSGGDSDDELARSKVGYQVPRLHRIDIVVPFVRVDRDSELDRLRAAIDPLLDGQELEEVGPESVMYLANRTQWDPRLVAMAVAAERAAGSSRIPAEHFYATFRTGAAGGQQAAHRLTEDRLQKAIEESQARGVIGSSAPLEATLEVHRREAARALREYVPAGGVSTLDELLAPRIDDAGRSLFIDRLRTSAGKPQELWKGLAEAGFERDVIQRLRTDGKLGFLTRHNGPVIQRVVEAHRIDRVEDLVDADLYEPDVWRSLVAGDVPVGLTEDDYVAGLAAQVRRAFPTKVTARLVRRGVVPIGDDDVAAGVADFLAGAEERLGAKPVSAWVGFDDLTPELRDGARRVQRLYQLSPSDQSMQVLAERGLDSALGISRYSEAEFLITHGEAFPSVREATLVYRKAQDVTGLGLHLATNYLVQRGLPPIHVLGGQRVPDLALDEAVPGKATLENLFGSLDFCACEHCRSVLSPAAYLVELFEFLDLHDVPHDRANPIDVLFARRPDLQHLQLSCENTNTAMPYVDLVNEILEHYVVHGNLAAFEGHDTEPGVASADLLVDPQFVQDAAYTTLAAEVFPPPMPLDVPLAALRLQFEAWGTTLATALSLGGARAAARRERLGLNAAELSILTDVDAHPLPVYFGEPAALSIDGLNVAIGNAKVLCGRIDVRYLELDAILRTRFVNPAVELLDLFTPLGLTVGDLRQWADGVTTDAELAALLPGDVDSDAYGGDIVAWLGAHRDRLFTLIVLRPVAGVDPTVDDCDFSLLEVHRADPGADGLTALDFHRLHRFVRLWRSLESVLDADIDAVDRLLVTFLGFDAAAVDLAILDATCAMLLDRLANLVMLFDEAGVSRRRRVEWLHLFDVSLGIPEREEIMARLLKLGVTDFRNLVLITGIDPLADDLHADEPSVLRFVRAARLIAASPLKVDDLDYLARDADAAGTRVPSPDEMNVQLRTIRRAIADVDGALAVVAGANLTTAESRMALVYEPDAVAAFFGLLTDTTTYHSPLATVEEGLPAAITAVTPAIGFDPFADELSFTGAMTVTDHADLLAAAGALTLADVDVIDTQPVLDAYIADLTTAIGALHAQPAAAIAEIGGDHPELVPLLNAALATADIEQRVAIILDGVLGPLRNQLVTTAVRAALTNLLRADETIVAALTAGSTVLHAHLDAGAGVLDDLIALGRPVEISVDGTHSMLVDPPNTGQYLWYIAAPSGTQLAVRIDGAVVIPNTPVGPSGELAGVAATSQSAGTLATVEIDVVGLPAGAVVELRWRGTGLPGQAVPGASMIEGAAAATAAVTMQRLAKVRLLVDKLRLTSRELTFLSGGEPDTTGVFDALPVGGPPVPAALHDLWRQFAVTLSFARLRKDTEPDTDVWVDVLETSALADPDGRLRVATLASWRLEDVAAALADLGTAGDDHQRVTTLLEVHRIVTAAVDAGLTVAEMTGWTVSDPDAALIDTMHDTLQARLDPASWRETMQSVNDALRNLRRDALVTHVIAHDPPMPEIATPNELYEHFLVDVEMDACLQTSRIRLALSTVQLFVTRCLMNLELEVAPGSIRQDRWAWMRRYRVWEANRKVFLWPENWLEPELRDGKSPFFRELESDLLKADITTDLAEDAYFSYLKKLDDVARLEIVGCYLEEASMATTDDDVLHLVGRTNGKTRQYWYRRRELGSWTPWEKIPLDIEGDLVLPVMWRGQLFLFWWTVVQKPQDGKQDTSDKEFADQKWKPRSRTNVELTLNWGELYQGKWTSPKSTNMRRPLVIRDLLDYHPEELLLFSRTEQPPGSSERLVFSVIYFNPQDTKAFKLVFTSKNASPIVVEDDPDNTLVNQVAVFYEELYWKRQIESKLDANSLDVPRKDATLRIAQPANAWTETTEARLLTKQGFKGWNARTVMHPIGNQWEAPFFYADEHSLFSVQPDESHTNFAIIEDYVPIAVAEFEPVIIDVAEPIVVPNPRDPLWDPPPWLDSTNPNIVNVLPDTTGFELDGWTFNALGLMR